MHKIECIYYIKHDVLKDTSSHVVNMLVVITINTHYGSTLQEYNVSSLSEAKSPGSIIEFLL